MTACCDVCQHPACWKAEIDLRRCAHQNGGGYFNDHQDNNNNLLRYDARNECIVEVDGSLPTYKTLDIVASGFPSAEKENVSEFYLPLLEFEEVDQPGSGKKENEISPLSGSINSSLGNYLKRLYDRRIDIQTREDDAVHNKLPSEKIFFKTLSIEDVESFGDKNSKVYTWIPGKKLKCKSADEARESKGKVVALKMIDGADLPIDSRLTDENKRRQKLTSHGGHSYRRRTVPCNLAPEDRDDYFELLRYIDLTRLNCDKINNQDVKIPSALQTARVKLYDASLENKIPRNLPKSKSAISKTRSNQNIEPVNENVEKGGSGRSETLFIRNGVILAKSPIFKPPEASKSRKRTPLPLTRVSVPKKAVRKLPLFDHCSSSIKKTDLPEVTMQPLSISENTSVMSVGKSPSLPGDINPLHVDGFTSPDLTRVPPSSPLSVTDEFILSPVNQLVENCSETGSDTQMEVTTNSPEIIDTNMNGDLSRLTDVPGERLDKEVAVSASAGKLHLDFNGDEQLNVGSAKVTPSTIMISKASKCDTPVYHKEFEGISRRSPTASIGSKGSVDGWLIDKDIISRTYDKYQSFSPFKTPEASAHLLKEDLMDKSKRTNNDNRALTSKRQILPPSLHNLDQFLPPGGEDGCLRPNTSFTTRSLSPSRSMFLRQQKQPPIEIVPSEITISRFPLLPAINKSQRSMRGDMSNQNLHENGLVFPETPRFEEEVIACDIVDDYEDGEEVLLNKEAFSTIDLLQSEVNSRPTSCETGTINTNELSVTFAKKNIPSPTYNNENSSSAPKIIDDSKDVIEDNLIIQSDEVMDENSTSGDGEYISVPLHATNFVNENIDRPQLPEVVSAGVKTKSVSIVNVQNESSFGNDESSLGNDGLSTRNDESSLGNDESSFGNDGRSTGNDGLSTGNEGLPPGNDRLPTGIDGLSTDKDGQYTGIDGSSSGNVESYVGNKEASFVEDDGSISANDNDMIVLTTNASFEDEDNHTISDNKLNSVEENTTIIGESGDMNPLNEEIISHEGSGVSMIPSTPPQYGNISSTYLVPDEVGNVNTIRDVNLSSPASVDHIYEIRTESPQIESTISPGFHETSEPSNELGDLDNSELPEPSTSVPNDVDVVSNSVDMAADTNHKVVSPDVIINDASVTEFTLSNVDEDGGNNLVVEEAKLDLPTNSNTLLTNAESTSHLSLSGSRIFRSSVAINEDPVQSVMKDIFNSQIVETSSLYLTPKVADDFSQGLDLDFELEEDIARAMHGLEEFVMDNYEAEVENN